MTPHLPRRTPAAHAATPRVAIWQKSWYTCFMNIQKEFPILEYDNDKNALIRPSNILQSLDIAARCVLCFFKESIEKALAEFPHKTVSEFRAGTARIPIYELEYKDARIVLIEAMVGAPLAAAQIEELSALGCRKFIACGMCGVLAKELAVGKLIIPICAVRDEGTSYHYIAPSREISADERVTKIIENVFSERKIPYVKAKTWTTDAFYRETPSKIALRKSEGCVAVEMENSAYVAAAQYNDVMFGQILCAGDSLAGELWDSRQYQSRTDIQELAFKLAIEICLKL